MASRINCTYVVDRYIIFLLSYCRVSAVEYFLRKRSSNIAVLRAYFIARRNIIYQKKASLNILPICDKYYLHDVLVTTSKCGITMTNECCSLQVFPRIRQLKEIMIFNVFLPWYSALWHLVQYCAKLHTIVPDPVWFEAMIFFVPNATYLCQMPLCQIPRNHVFLCQMPLAFGTIIVPNAT